ncbi:MAG: mitochondrial fission ELM1 family protein [Rhodospirillales bacterium]|nr:mitochondrial fission ELM1 family protein [Rhodospirillales bacterium]MCB9973026.1 mitochondrial fission ELM1 family protein [Rhodospirillales bacterium]
MENISVWVVTEGMVGTENQCLGVAESLGVVPVVKRITLRQPWKTLSPWLACECMASFEPPLQPPWPDLLLTSGRKAVAAARYIRKKSKGRTFTVHIQDPRITPDAFDLVVVPFHDPTRGENVLVTDAAPNLISSARLEAARAQFSDLNNYPAPRIAVLIGGKSKAYEMTQETVLRLIEQLKALQKDRNASLFITASRRTGPENMALLQKAFPNSTQTVFWTGEGDNPYMGYLAYADYILVTADSVSMISDALATGRPTYVIPLPGGGRRIDLFHQHIQDKGFACEFSGEMTSYEYAPVRESARIAEVIRNKMMKTGE